MSKVYPSDNEIFCSNILRQKSLCWIRFNLIIVPSEFLDFKTRINNALSAFGYEFYAEGPHEKVFITLGSVSRNTTGKIEHVSLANYFTYADLTAGIDYWALCKIIKK